MQLGADLALGLNILIVIFLLAVPFAPIAIAGLLIGASLWKVLLVWAIVEIPVMAFYFKSMYG